MTIYVVHLSQLSANRSNCDNNRWVKRTESAMSRKKSNWLCQVLRKKTLKKKGGIYKEEKQMYVSNREMELDGKQRFHY